MCIERQTREEARILIVCDDDSLTERLNIVFREAGLMAECVKSITAGCEAVRSGRFRVVVTTPLLDDGWWRRLVDLADHYDLALEVILLAWTFELNQWAEALGEGAFDVLDALHELPKAAEVTKRALEAAYVKRTRPRHEAELRSSSAGDPEEERVSSLLCEAGQAAGGSRNILGSEREAVIAEPEAQATKPECRPETRT